MAQDSLIYIVEKLLQKTRIAFDRGELEFQIETHLSYLSLSAITDVLDHFDIAKAAARIPQSPDALIELLKNAIGEAFCSSGSEKKNCHAVLSSEGARLFGSYKLTDLSLTYFAGHTMGIFLLSIQGLGLFPINVLGLLSLPITIYSVYYQAFKLKTWCFLCLSIVAILWLQAGIPLWFQSLTYPT